MSNDWKLDINIDKIKEKEDQNIKDMLIKVKEIEKITKITENVLVNNSIYSELYKPKYIEEMNDMEKIKELSKTIQDRLRNVKLAVSKANLNYNKMVELSKKQKLDNEKLNNLMKAKRKYNRYNSAFYKNYSFKNNKLVINNNNQKLLNQNKDINEGIKKSNNNSLIKDNEQLPRKESEKITLKPQNMKQFLPELKSQYALDRTQLKTPNDIFNKYQIDFSQGYKAIFRPFKKLFRKTKDSKKHIARVKSSIIPKRNINNLIDEDLEKERNSLLQKSKKFNYLEKCLKQLEQSSS